MKLRVETSRIALAAGVLTSIVMAAAPVAAQTHHVVPGGTTDTAQKTVAGTDSITVQAGGTLQTTTSPAINWNNASTGLVITNLGTIRSTNASGRAINASGDGNVRSITLTNNAGAVIESADDAFRINVNPTGGTITVDNHGIIRTTIAGQALDFDAVATDAATIIINNHAGAELRSTGQDAIRPGQGAVVTNAGLIRSDGAPNNSFDGIDWQARSGKVINQAGGVISGLRHGITSDTSVDVVNAAGATITGRNGSGVGSDGDGIVVNYGTITGQWDGVATNGDGDGVDIDLVGTIRNYGTIEGLSAAGVDSGGSPNNAQGIAMGGGLIENAAGATIVGGADAILIDDGSGGGAYGSTAITNAGTIRGLAGTGIVLVGDFADTITNSGTIAGATVALDMGAGNDTLNVQTGAVFTGAVDGGAGMDRINFNGSGSFAGAAGFEQVAVQTGTWTLTGALAADNYQVDAGATLTSATSATIASTATPLSISNSGTIANSNATGRAINIAGSNNARDISITNNAGAVIQSADDAVRVNFNPTGGTITLNNAGIIKTTNGGQAIDFDAAASGGATIVINNLAGGELRSFGQDAIRPGQGAVVTNAGLIYSDGPANNNYDGVDWQGKSGKVINQSGGVISGLRHGITSDVNVDVTNAAGATIIGRNGSGVGSDGGGIVVNNGTIIGTWDGVATNGDGDGVDIDLIGTVRNFGTIRGISATGVDSGGRPNSAQGIAMGGGTIENAANALISGGRNGILIDDGADNGAYGATTIVNAGRIEGLAGPAITLVGDFADTITNSGTIAGTGGIAIQMGGGNDALNLLAGSVIIGSVDGGTGRDTVTLGGPGTGSFAGAVNFERLAVASGSWTLTAASSFSEGTTIAGGATLTGNSTTLTGAIANAGTLRIDQADAGTLAATLTGTGLLQKLGAGTLAIGAQPGFAGPVDVLAGRLNVLGAMPSAVRVANGATLGGTGTIAGATIQSGGTIAPGLSVGTLTITGQLVQEAGSTYAAEITSAGADRIAVGSIATIRSGATLAVTRASGDYTVGSRYTLLTAAGGVSGNYTTMTQNPLGNTELRLGSNANAIYVDVVRTGASLALLGLNPNQVNTATAFGTLGVANPAYAALTLIPSDDAVRTGLDLLSGEIHASVSTAMVLNAIAAQAALAPRFSVDTAGPAIWGQFVASSDEDSGILGAADAERETTGGIGGVDFGFASGARIGIAGGFTSEDLTVAARRSTAKLETVHVMAYAGGSFGGVNLRGGIGYGRVDVSTVRDIAFPGFTDHAVADYKGTTLHGFAEIGMPIAIRGGAVEPFAGLGIYRVKTDGFNEAGGPVALRVAAREDTFGLGKLGVKASTPIVGGLSGRGSLAWQHVFGDLVSTGVHSFGASVASFGVTGTALSRDAAAATVALDWRMSKAATLSVSYDGLIGKNGSQSNGRLTLSIGF
ncbi:autotransporter domain-containing protein [Sphingomonas colocasiae]|uniref:Autotransporter domain-containing protein n=1 Tax=Sphingomonas colocasiae TaxID=1848973 RepID=A0ABS7PNL8_9SPHN|nr:autotransporter domain-containing protein [Sphingomonas colocasiae]MBY8822811.1 autotransporter domain-containing protein [Sphingomonas colocasiae]